jgi:squalene-hopene/tetraprenyl-beta-curcumene cyclase
MVERALGQTQRKPRQSLTAPLDALETGLQRAETALRGLQQPSGHWVFELEADCTIPAEYILMMHYMDEVDADLQARMARYLREHQQQDGGWPLYHAGAMDLSCTVKAYYALKLAGDPPEAEHMQRARQAVLARGGAARANVFTRITLALFEQIPWRGVPFMPVEIILLPRWFAFHTSKIAYWSRTVMVPLLILYSCRARARNPSGIGVAELFTTPPWQERNYFPVRSRLNRLLLLLERSARRLDPLLPASLRRRALRRAESWLTTRLNGKHGLGAIFPAMVNAYEALDCLGYPPEHPYRQDAAAALRSLLVERGDTAYCQPCVSPVWDTALACHALQAVGGAEARAAAERGLDWLAERQLCDAPGDWREQRPHLACGGWAFQFRNDYYPDLDDTAAVAWAMHQQDPQRYASAVRRAALWLCGMQSKCGGFAAFDADNTYHYLNEIPFADHGALLDPPSADVTARCVTLLARLAPSEPCCREPLQRAIACLRSQQRADGAWFGRWGTNYIYGTWSALVALAAAGAPADDPALARGRAWLKACQQADGGWGESNDSYEDPALGGAPSTSFQTAWALLGLMAAGEPPGRCLQAGVEFLLRRQDRDGLWQDEAFTAPGFPRVFYLKYHGYSKYFPVWALGRYRQLLQSRA